MKIGKQLPTLWAIKYAWSFFMKHGVTLQNFQVQDKYTIKPKIKRDLSRKNTKLPAGR